MSEPSGSKFEGMVLARLGSIEERLDELLRQTRDVERRCRTEYAERATLAAELRAVREKTNLNARVLWGAIAWIVVTAVGTLLAVLRNDR